MCTTRPLAAATSVLAFAFGLVRCVLFTGTGGAGDGYQSGATVGGCQAASECDAGDVCCLGASASASGPKATCSALCESSGSVADASAPFQVQLCKTNEECRGGIFCVPQSCMFADASVAATIQACGPVPFCVVQ